LAINAARVKKKLKIFSLGDHLDGCVAFVRINSGLCNVSQPHYRIVFRWFFKKATTQLPISG
jgi:hypothetical protein